MDAATLTALAEPSRLRIVELLATRPHTVGEVAAALGMRQPQVTKHLQTLSRAGLVTVHPLGQRRVCALERSRLRDLRDWLDGLAQDEPQQAVLDQYRRAVDAETAAATPIRRGRRAACCASPAASRAAGDVWAHWTTPALLGWWTPEGFHVADAAIEPRAGGAARLVLAERDGATHTASGRVTVADAPRALDFELAPLGPDGDPLFTAAHALRLEPDTDGTRLELELRVLSSTAEAAPAIAGMRPSPSSRRRQKMKTHPWRFVRHIALPFIGMISALCLAPAALAQPRYLNLTWVDRSGEVIEVIGAPGEYRGLDVSPDGAARGGARAFGQRRRRLAVRTGRRRYASRRRGHGRPGQRASDLLARRHESRLQLPAGRCLGALHQSRRRLGRRRARPQLGADDGADELVARRPLHRVLGQHWVRMGAAARRRPNAVSAHEDDQSSHSQISPDGKWVAYKRAAMSGCGVFRTGVRSRARSRPRRGSSRAGVPTAASSITRAPYRSE